MPRREGPIAPPEETAVAGPTLEVADARGSENDGPLRFMVSLAGANGERVTVRYATEDGTATAGPDYRAVSDTLTFSADSTTTRTIQVPVHDDAVAEPTETFTMRLSDAHGATLPAATATGAIRDDDSPSVTVRPAELSVAKGAPARYTIALSSQPTTPVTISISPATAELSVTPPTLTFDEHDWATAQTVTVTATEAAMPGDIVTIDHTASGGDGATLSVTPISVTINARAGGAPRQPRQLSALQVTGGGAMYPAFDPGIHHYALTCADPTTLRVTAQTRRSGAQLKLLRANPDDSPVSTTGTLDASVTVHDASDLAIEVSDAGSSVTYVVHCLPTDFPDIRIVTSSEHVSDGLLFVTPINRSGVSFMAILDNRGVPRFHRGLVGGGKVRDFRRHANAPVIDGKRAWYSVFNSMTGTFDLLDERFETIRSVGTVGNLTHTDPHDFRFTAEGNYLFGSLHTTTRDITAYIENHGGPPVTAKVTDSVIQEVSPDGTVQFEWNSWDHVKIDPDCMGYFPLPSTPGHPSKRDYAHINSFHLVGGDVIASFRHCSQVLRIDRSSGTGVIEWKLGGTSPTRHSATEYLEIVNDDAGEICAQHQATLTESDTVVLFDNGNHCIGERKNEEWYTRVVEYDISSRTQARLEREYRQRNERATQFEGGVTVLENGHWLISWGPSDATGAEQSGVIAISEVDQSGTAVLEIHMSRSGKLFDTYRVYRERESDVQIPLDLP